MKWLKKQREREEIKIKAHDRLVLQCPQCETGGVVLLPEGLRLVIQGSVLLFCDRGHHAWTLCNDCLEGGGGECENKEANSV